MEFSRQEYWNGLPFPSPGDLPDPGIEPLSLESPALQVDSLPAELQWKAKHQPTREGYQIIKHWWQELFTFQVDTATMEDSMVIP